MIKIFSTLILLSFLSNQLSALPQNNIPTNFMPDLATFSDENQVDKYLDYNKLAEAAKQSKELSVVKPIEEIEQRHIEEKHDELIKDHLTNLSKVVDLEKIHNVINNMYNGVKQTTAQTEKKMGDSVHHIVDALHHMSSKLLTILMVFIFTLVIALLLFIYVRKYEHFGGPLCLTKFCVEQNLIDKDDYYTGESDDELAFDAGFESNTYRRGSLPRHTKEF